MRTRDTLSHDTAATYEQRREQERREEQARWDKAATALEILGFNVLPIGEGNSESNSHNYGVVGVRPSDNLRLFIWTATNRGKFEVTHSLRNELHEVKSYDERRLEIGMSWSKTPKQIAKDIQRRLLPDAEAQYERVSKRLAEHQRFETAKGETYKRMTTALGVNPSEWEIERDTVTKYQIGSYRVEAKVNSADSVEIEIRYLNAEQAEKILKVLAND